MGDDADWCSSAVRNIAWPKQADGPVLKGNPADDRTAGQSPKYVIAALILGHQSSVAAVGSPRRVCRPLTVQSDQRSRPATGPNYLLRT